MLGWHCTNTEPFFYHRLKPQYRRTRTRCIIRKGRRKKWMFSSSYGDRDKLACMCSVPRTAVPICSPSFCARSNCRSHWSRRDFTWLVRDWRVVVERERGKATLRETVWERERDRQKQIQTERGNSNSETLILNDRSVTSISTYPTASPFYTTKARF